MDTPRCCTLTHHSIGFNNWNPSRTHLLSLLCGAWECVRDKKTKAWSLLLLITIETLQWQAEFPEIRLNSVLNERSSKKVPFLVACWLEGRRFHGANQADLSVPGECILSLQRRSLSRMVETTWLGRRKNNWGKNYRKIKMIKEKGTS